MKQVLNYKSRNYFVDIQVKHDLRIYYIFCPLICIPWRIGLEEVEHPANSSMSSFQTALCIRSCFSQVVVCRRGGDRIHEMRCLLVAVGPNDLFIVLTHWDNMS